MAFLFDRVKDACTGLVHFLRDISVAAGEIPTDPDADDDGSNDDANLHRTYEEPQLRDTSADELSKGKQQNGQEVTVEVPQLTGRIGEKQFEDDVNGEQITALMNYSKGERQKGQEIVVEVPELTERVGDKIFHDGAEKMTSLKIPNVEMFPGFCTQIEKSTTECNRRIVNDIIRQALCFEYLPKGNLDKYLSDEHERLDWHAYYKIIVGICEGLRYIHEELGVPMYHLSLKPDNISIDEKMVIKVTHLGVPRAYDEQRIGCITSRLGGELLLPGYARQQVLSKEFDIFNLGLLIMKIMGTPMTGDMQHTKIIELVHDTWKKRLQSAPGCKSLEVNCQQVKRCIEIAINCLEENIYERPNIGDIIRELNKTSINFPVSPVGEAINDGIYEYNSKYPGLVAQRLKLDFLKKITNNFSNKRILGAGGFATVYKGVDEDGRAIAVKKISITSKVDSKQFENEARHLSTLTHQNIVKLEGYCYEEKMLVVQHEGREVQALEIYMLLCVELLPKGSLDRYLSDATSGLNWSQRYKIIEGICNGLHYLHEGKEGSPIIHRDLKPANILLDDNMIPKIADFGISRLIGEDKTHTRTVALVGTWVYLPLEFIQKGIISKKLDIYSLGLIIIEVISGKRICCDNIERLNEEFIELLDKWRSRLQKEGSMEENYSQLHACIILSMECMDKDPQKRPTTEQIIHTLSKTKECQLRSGGSFHLPSALELPSLETYDGDKGQYNSENELEDASPFLIELSLQFIKDITKNFCRELEIGQGVTGVVYQGVHPSGEIIAVKRLQKTIRGNGRQFRNTVGDLLALEHKNIAKLIGCCYGVEREVASCNRGSLHVYKQDNFLCYEYLHGESLDKYIYDKSCKLNWDTRLRILKEICEGLHFLHVESGRDIIHLNLKLSSIILDDKMVPRITNSGLYRLFGQEHTPPRAEDVSERLVYLAPEYLYCGEEKLESDIYSLGLLIMEVVTGKRSCSNEDVLLPWHFIGNVRNYWTDTSYIKSKYPSLDTDGINQVHRCIMIGLQCADIRPKERPRIGVVLSELDKICPVPTELLSVYSLQLRFPFKRNRLCTLQLTNRTDDRVAVRLLSDNQKKCMARGVVPPRSTYTLVVSMRKPPKSGEFFSMESCAVGERGLNLKDVDLDSTNREFHDFFKEAQTSSAKKVHQQKMEVICGAQDELIQPGIEIISKANFPQVLSVDVHLTEPWIMTSHHGGQIFIWDYHTQEIVVPFEVSEESVYSAKFVEREQWLVAGDDDGDIYVYSYIGTQQQIASFRGHCSRIESLAVHPSLPFILSSSAHLIELWNWENNWECTQTFKEHSDRVTQITFNPVDPNSFASAALDHTIKIWNVSSPNSRITLSADGPQCLFYIINDIGQFLISDSQDGTTKIWDLETHECVQTLKGHANHLGSLYRHSDMRVLVNGSVDGTVRLLNPITYRTEKTVGLNLGAVYAFGYLADLRRVIIGCHRGIAIIEPHLL